jgi:hypothetical protein
VCFAEYVLKVHVDAVDLLTTCFGIYNKNEQKMMMMMILRVVQKWFQEKN